jgi:hypothetical protein
MKTKTILIGASIAAAVVGVVWYVKNKKVVAAPVANAPSTPNTQTVIDRSPELLKLIKDKIVRWIPELNKYYEPEDGNYYTQTEIEKLLADKKRGNIPIPSGMYTNIFDPSKFGYDPNIVVGRPIITAPILRQEMPTKRLPAPEVITNGYNRYQRDTQMAGFRYLLS